MSKVRTFHKSPMVNWSSISLSHKVERTGTVCNLGTDLKSIFINSRPELFEQGR